MTDVEQIFHAIQDLPVRERLQLVERVVHALASSAGDEVTPSVVDVAPTLLGLFADEPDLVDEVSRAAMTARRRDPLRTGSGSDEGAA